MNAAGAFSTTSKPPIMKARERTMTGETCSSIGSFATYLSHEESYKDITTTDIVDGQLMPVTPVVSDIQDEQEVGVIMDTEEQIVAQDALEALQHVMEGIRIITRQMKRSHNAFYEQEIVSCGNEEGEVRRERSWSDSCSTIQSCASDDDLRLSVLSRQLDGTLGADLMGLAHAAQMLGENSRMAAQEASHSVQDVTMAQQSIDEANARASKAESAVRIMYKKQKELIGQLEKAKNERHVLKRQVKALLKEKQVMKEQEHVVRALELHVVGALQAHESQLALQHAKRQEEGRNDESGNVATVRLEACPSQDDEDLVAPVSEPEVHEEHFAPKKKPAEKKGRSVFEAAQEDDNKDEKAKAIANTKSSSNAPPATKKAEAPKSVSIFDAAQDSEEISLMSFLGLGPDPVVRDDKASKAGNAEKTDVKKTAPRSRGFGSALGLRGSFRRSKQQEDSKPPEPDKKAVASEKKTSVETKEEENAQKPTLISPTNSVEESTAEACDTQSPSITTDKDDASTQVEQSSSAVDASITTDSISPCNQATLISPSPTDNSSTTKGFFHRSKKEQRRAAQKAAAAAKKPLLHLDDTSVDTTEGSHDFTFTSDTLPTSEVSSTASIMSCDVNLNPVPPDSLTCKTTEVSPFAHDFAMDTPTAVLDDKAFRSLAFPSFVGGSKNEVTPTSTCETLSLDSPVLPPELAEIAEIYAEIGQLHEC